MDGIKWTDIAIALIALYAAGLSTYNLIAERRGKRPHVRIKLSFAMLAYPGQVRAALFFEMSNPGERPITLTSVGLQLPNKQRLFMPHLDGTMPLPAELHPGQTAKFWMQPDILEESLRGNGWSGDVRLRAFCVDGTDNRYVSRALLFNVKTDLNA